MSSSHKWPNKAKAALTLTLDNMGEAADLQRNLWPSSKPLGSHYSVTDVLPQLLALLDKHSIKATYYTEAWNTTVYPDALRELIKRGHEVAWHAYQHEPWSKYEGYESDERENIRKSFEAIARLEAGDPSVRPYKGFRPPGGQLTTKSFDLFQEFGLDYVSPAAEEVAIVAVPTSPSSESSATPTGKGSPGDHRIVVLPFTWSTVDAYYYMEAFAGLRRIKAEYTNPSPPHSPAELKRRYIQAIDDTIERGGYLAPLFHPFLTNQADRLQVFDEVLGYIKERTDKGELWVARADEVATWVRQHGDMFGNDPRWDTSSWR